MPSPDAETVSTMIMGCGAAITRDAGLPAAPILASDRLKVIVVHGAGHDAVDKRAAHEKGVLVCNTPAPTRNRFPELALGLMLAAAPAGAGRRSCYSFSERSFREGHTFHGVRARPRSSSAGARRAPVGRMLRAASACGFSSFHPKRGYRFTFQRAGTLAEGLARSRCRLAPRPMREETRGMIDKIAFALRQTRAILVNLRRVPA